LTNFVVRPRDPLEDSQEELLKHKELIILFEAVRYCELYGIDRIRYTKLKQISNNRLASLSLGRETDFGGNFKLFIKKFENEYFHHIELINRIRPDKNTSFIVPNIQKIADLFGKVDLNTLFDEEALVNDPLLMEYEDSYTPIHESDGQPKKEGRIIDLFAPENVYIARYYYKNGHPVFLNPAMADGTTLYVNAIDSDPFYIRTNYLYEKAKNNNKKSRNNNPILISDPWYISSDDNLKLKEDNIQLLLSLGKKIASKDPTRPFKISLEYQGTPAGN
jgi:hypothetical protein